MSILLKAAAYAILTSLVSVAQSDPNVLYIEQNEDTQSLLDNGLALVNLEMVEEVTGNPAFMAAKAGVEYIAANPTHSEAVVEGLSEVTAAEASTGGFEILSDVKLEKKRVRRGSKYPFAQLEVGQGFFVPVGHKATEDSDPLNEPWKTMQSACSAANRSYRADNGVYEKRFTQARQTQNDAEGKPVDGAMVMRVAVEEEAVQLEKIAKRKAKAEAKAASATTQG